MGIQKGTIILTATQVDVHVFIVNSAQVGFCHTHTHTHTHTHASVQVFIACHAEARVEPPTVEKRFPLPVVVLIEIPEGMDQRRLKAKD